MALSIPSLTIICPLPPPSRSRAFVKFLEKNFQLTHGGARIFVQISVPISLKPRRLRQAKKSYGDENGNGLFTRSLQRYWRELGLNKIAQDLWLDGTQYLTKDYHPVKYFL